jgi:hypothetical protein
MSPNLPRGVPKPAAWQQIPRQVGCQHQDEEPQAEGEGEPEGLFFHHPGADVENQRLENSMGAARSLVAGMQ